MKKKIVSKMMLTVLLVGILTLVFNIRPVEAKPRTITVPDNYPTIQGAIDAADWGDTIFVKAGTYNENPTVFFRNNLTLQGEDRQGTILNGSITLFFASNTKIENFQILGGVLSGPWRSGGVGIINNIIHSGISLSGGNHEVKNNIIEGGLHISGMIPGGFMGGHVVEKNTFYGAGIEMFATCQNSINRNTIINASIGISEEEVPYIGIGANNSITGNIILNCEVGVEILSQYYIVPASYTRILGNTFENNNIGVFLVQCSTVTVYHNNFINNTIQTRVNQSYNNTWDDGYSSGGNYWSDYDVADFYSGPFQNETGSDGIGDTPYVIDENNQDKLPLMATPQAIDYVIQNLPSPEFTKPEEDVEDTKSDFADKSYDLIENIDEGNYEHATGHLETIKELALDRIVESAERQKIIFMVDCLIAYLENF